MDGARAPEILFGIASSSNDGILWLTLVLEKRHFHHSLDTKGVVYSVVFSSDATLLASGSSGATIRVWDAQRGQQVRPPLRGYACVKTVCFPLYCVGIRRKTFWLWDARSGVNEEYLPPSGHLGHISSGFLA